MAIISTHKVSTLAYEIKTPKYTILSDVSESLGGHSLGPDPHDLMEAALAGCTAMTVQMYARRKQIPLEDVDVKIKITEEGAVNKIERTVEFKGPLTHEQQVSLLAIANKCPVHRFLERGATITTQLAGDTHG